MENIQHPTSNIERPSEWRACDPWMLGVGCSMLDVPWGAHGEGEILAPRQNAFETVEATPHPIPSEGERIRRKRSRIEPLNRTLGERRRKSGVKDARTPNAS